jgi:hypothetical protein
MGDAEIVDVTDEASTSAAKSYRGGRSINAIYKYRGTYFLRHVVVSRDGKLLHDTYKPWSG